MKWSTLTHLAPLALALVVVSAPAARARDDKGGEKTPPADAKAGDDACTVKGVVAGVTVVGETMVDHDTNRAVIAQVTYLSVVGRPADADTHDHDSSSGHEDKKAARPDDGSGSRSKRGRANLYVLAVSPRTEVCDCTDGSKSACDLARIELGDRVEVRFTGRPSGDKTPSQAKHGKSRTYLGQAQAIEILPQDEGGQASGSDSASGPAGPKDPADKADPGSDTNESLHETSHKSR